jgi:hypothetical protein
MVVVGVDFSDSAAHPGTKVVSDKFEEFEKQHPAVAHVGKDRMLNGNRVLFPKAVSEAPPTPFRLD